MKKLLHRSNQKITNYLKKYKISLELIMSDIEKNPTLVLSQQAINKEIMLERIAVCLNNINLAYKEFPLAYKRNNIYGLFNIGKEFYTNSMNFILYSQYLYKHQLLDFSEHNSGTIVNNMNELKSYIDNLKNERNEWLCGNSLMDEPSFAESFDKGTEHFKKLEKKIKTFLDAVSREKNHGEANVRQKFYAKTI